MSEGTRGDVPDIGVILQDYADLLHHFRREAPDQPLFLLGHSQGGAISLAVTAELEQQVSGVILLNPAFRLKPGTGPSPWEMLRYSFYYLFHPSLPVVSTVPHPERIAHAGDRAEVLAKRHDPRVVGKLSVRFLMGSKRLMDMAEAYAARVLSPVLLLYGDQDAFIDHRGSEAVLARWGGADRSQIVLEGGGHGAHITSRIGPYVTQWLLSHS